ncbi:Probable methyltransferase PMT18 [Linum perenne]
MDMNDDLRGFTDMLVKYQVLVMNVVPSDLNYDTFGAIYERGFIGTYQDRCGAFSMYHEMYDLIHVGNVYNIHQDKYVMFIMSFVASGAFNYLD